MKNNNYLYSCSLWFQEEVLLPVVKKIPVIKSRIRIQGVKKHRILDTEQFLKYERVHQSGNVFTAKSWATFNLSIDDI
jgi:hypothetical protein